MNEQQVREAICTFGKSCFDRGLTAGSSGNISVRLDDGWLLTPTNGSLGALDPARLAKMNLENDQISGDLKSKEAPLHQAIYEKRASARAVVHLHSTHSTAVSCMSGLDHANCISPLTPYFVMKIGRLPLIPYHRPGDPALGDAIRFLAADHSAMLLANHGPVVSGTSLEAAVYAAEELEETAKLFLLLQGHNFRVLDEVQIGELKGAFKLDS